MTPDERIAELEAAVARLVNWGEQMMKASRYCFLCHCTDDPPHTCSYCLALRAAESGRTIQEEDHLDHGR